MAISLMDGIDYGGKEPNFSRDLFETVADMVDFNENYLPPVFECNVVEDGKRYRYMESNSVDPTLGKWREVTGGEAPYWVGTLEEWEELDKSTLAEETIVYITNDSEDGKIDVYTKEEVDELLEKKIDNEQSLDDVGKFFTVDDEGKVVLEKIKDPHWVGTMEEWEALDKDTLEDGTVIIITDDLSADVLADYYNKAEADELLNKKLDVKQDVVNEGKAVKVGSDGNLVLGSIDAVNVNVEIGGVKKTLQSALDTPNGIACLDANGKIPVSELPTSARQIVGYVDAENVHTLPSVDDYDGGAELIVTSNGYILQSTAFTLTSGKLLTDMEVSQANKLIGNGYVFTLFEEATNKGTVKSFESNKVTLDDDTEIALPHDKDLSATSTPNVVQIPVMVGDEIMTIDGHWVHLSNTSSVTSVNGMTGAVTIDGGGTADKVGYENENHPSWDNVEKALNGLIAKVYYVKPSITSFTTTPSTTVYEKGQTVSALTFKWALNKDVTTQSLTGCTVTVDDREATYNTEISAKKTFTLSVGDGENTDSKSFTVDFQNKIYSGSASEGTYDSAFILGLATKKFATAKAGTYSVTVGAGQYGYIAYPKSMGQIEVVKIGGFDTDMVNCGDVSFTNASGYTETYNIVRTGRSGLGAISMVVS